jgi:hypothetical protein
MSDQNYRQSIKDALWGLMMASDDVFGQLFPIAISGELKEWGKSVPVGEWHNLSIEVYQGCDDMNIRLICDLLQTMSDTIESISNINDIDLDILASEKRGA